MATFTDGSAEERKQNKEKRRHQELQAVDRDRVVNALYETREGRNYLWWLLEITQAYGHNPYRGTDRDTAFMCGMQNVGQQLLGHMMTVNPAAFAKMLLERTDEQVNPSILNAGLGRRASPGSESDAEFDPFGRVADTPGGPGDSSEYR